MYLYLRQCADRYIALVTTLSVLQRNGKSRTKRYSHPRQSHECAIARCRLRCTRWSQRHPQRRRRWRPRCILAFFPSLPPIDQHPPVAGRSSKVSQRSAAFAPKKASVAAAVATAVATAVAARATLQQPQLEYQPQGQGQLTWPGRNPRAGAAHGNNSSGTLMHYHTQASGLAP